MIDIIDVTLRDGGHSVSFDWPLNFTTEYYKTITTLPDVRLIELGYWGQKSKSENMYYNLDFDKVCQVTSGAGKRNVAVMVDYHYCSHNLLDYPDSRQREISMIRICSRKEDLDDCLTFASRLKEKTGLEISLNIFNITNYQHEELIKTCKKLNNRGLDFVYFADTHGSLNLANSGENFKTYIDILKDYHIKVGMHLHDHSGKAYFNYCLLSKLGFDSADASSYGVGKGEGNLRLEHVVVNETSLSLLQVISDNRVLLTSDRNPYCLLTAKYSLTDYYALKAQEKRLSFHKFETFCQKIRGRDKDVYNGKLLEEFCQCEV